MIAAPNVAYAGRKRQVVNFDDGLPRKRYEASRRSKPARCVVNIREHGQEEFAEQFEPAPAVHLLERHNVGLNRVQLVADSVNASRPTAEAGDAADIMSNDCKHVPPSAVEERTTLCQH